MSTPAFNQDDARERAMIQTLNLGQRTNRARHEEDAHLDVVLEDGSTQRLLFELKSAPVDGDYGTGRDTGIPQLRRWSTMHFAFAWFTARDNQPRRIWYGSPAMMRPWNQAEQDYRIPDITLTEITPDLVDAGTVARVLGEKDEYDYEDLHRLMKAQWNANAELGQPNLYLTKADVHRGAQVAEFRYSPQVALEAVRDRVRYLLARGSTVNNRKISNRYVLDHCVEITGPGWAVNLDRAVRAALAEQDAAAARSARTDEQIDSQAGGHVASGLTSSADGDVLATAAADPAVQAAAVSLQQEVESDATDGADGAGRADRPI